MFWQRKKTTTVSPRGKVDLNGNLWVKCPGCGANIYEKKYRENLWVCPRCQKHRVLDCRQRIEITLDNGSFAEEDAWLAPADPLHFQAVKTYREKIEEDGRRTGLNDAVIAGSGTVKEIPVQVVVMDSRFIMGSMGAVVGEKFARASERAIDMRCPFVVFSASGGGARMYEGMFSLMQMAKTASAVGRLAEEGVPYVSVLTEPTMAGVAASFAFLGDVIIAEPNALIGFTGPRVIEQTIRARLPEGFQRAEFWHKKGAIDMVVPRRDMRTVLGRLLKLLFDGTEES